MTIFLEDAASLNDSSIVQEREFKKLLDKEGMQQATKSHVIIMFDERERVHVQPGTQDKLSDYSSLII